MIIQTYAETRLEPSSGISTSEAVCRLCEHRYDADDEAGYTEGCCDQHGRCQQAECLESSHPKSDEGFCAWHALLDATEYVQRIIAGEEPSDKYIPAKHQESVWAGRVWELNKLGRQIQH